MYNRAGVRRYGKAGVKVPRYTALVTFVLMEDGQRMALAQPRKELDLKDEVGD